LEENQFTTLTLPSNGVVLDLDGYTPGALDSERIRSYELGLIHLFPEWRSSIDLKFYIEDIDNAIGDVRQEIDPGIENAAFGNIAWINTNEDGWQTKGLDLQWRAQPWQHSWFNLAYGYADAEGRYARRPENISDPWFDRDNDVPRHTLSILLSHDFGDQLEGSMILYRQSAVEWFKGSTLPAYNRVDFRIAQGFQYGKSEGQVELVVQNLSPKYTEFEVNNLFDTRTFVRFKLNFL